jgi:hypothetical protein
MPADRRKPPRLSATTVPPQAPDAGSHPRPKYIEGRANNDRD